MIEIADVLRLAIELVDLASGIYVMPALRSVIGVSAD